MSTFRCLLIERDASKNVTQQISLCDDRNLPPGDVLIQVAYSSLNYKDALATRGHQGVVRSFPHVPGIDCAGTVLESAAGEFLPGQEVLVTGFELGAGVWGGYAEHVRVPADWVVPLPSGLSLREAMILGTAGFTAAQSVETLLHHGVRPDAGEVLVTGASGGVGCLAVAMLRRAGFRVVASSGKADAAPWLERFGAARVVDRQAVSDDSDKPMLRGHWSGAVDTVGGKTLATIVRSLKQDGCVAACGLVGGAELPLTVYPFLMRGVTLAGIDSAHCPRSRRLGLWARMANEWRPPDLADLARETPLDALLPEIDAILRGDIRGRVVVRIGTR